MDHVRAFVLTWGSGALDGIRWETSSRFRAILTYCSGPQMPTGKRRSRVAQMIFPLEGFLM